MTNDWGRGCPRFLPTIHFSQLRRIVLTIWLRRYVTRMFLKTNEILQLSHFDGLMFCCETVQRRIRVDPISDLKVDSISSEHSMQMGLGRTSFIYRFKPSLSFQKFGMQIYHCIQATGGHRM